MIIIDTNALIVLLLGYINPDLIDSHKRTSIYSKEDFDNLQRTIGDIKNLVTLPNVWTEVDNLLQNLPGDNKYKYVRVIAETIKRTSEKYLNSSLAVESPSFYKIGLTDSLILDYAKKCDLLITADSSLSDFAIANNIRVYDMVKSRNDRPI